MGIVPAHNEVCGGRMGIVLAYHRQYGIRSKVNRRNLCIALG